MVVILSYLYLSFVALTSRIRVTSASEESITTLRERRPAVYAFWFQHIVFLLYYFGTRKMPILMTPQAKTDRLTRLSEWMGLRVAKGSLEGGGRHALVTLLDQLKAGTAVAIPADGSRGPERKCKAGCFILGQETGSPIIPTTWKALFRIKIPRKYGPLYIPLPFNSIEIKLGAPVVVNRHYQFAELEGIRTQLTNQLDRLAD
ncbi:MAG: DUF374 domain-containing protein [Deltaproteobacteria bacterium]|nr:DUF374 domain-containing protein [Deltaproteobacteria bacterium]